MFKVFVYTCALIFTLAVIKTQASPVGNQPYVVNYTNFQTPEGYYYNVQLSDYSSKQETGILEDVEDEDGDTVKAMKATGSYQFIAPDGSINTITYVADKNGYHPRISKAYINNKPQNQVQAQAQTPIQVQAQTPVQVQVQTQNQAQAPSSKPTPDSSTSW